jgi:hypothetical protein
MLGRLDASFSQRLPGFTHRSVHVGFEADKVTLGPGFISVSNNRSQTYRNKRNINVAERTSKPKT